jgi:hypothetical protein
MTTLPSPLNSDQQASLQAIGGAINALTIGAQERENANMAIKALQTSSAIASALQIAEATLQKLGVALVTLDRSPAAPGFEDLRETVLDLTRLVSDVWSGETVVLELMAEGRLGDATEIGEAINSTEPQEQVLSRSLIRALHEMATQQPAVFAALGLKNATLVGWGFPNPDSQPQLDADQWLAELLENLGELDRVERGAALRGEAESWQVHHQDLTARRDDLLKEMTPETWFAGLRDASARVEAIAAHLTGPEGWESVAAVPANFPGSGQSFILAADGSGDFTSLEDAVAAIPSGARLAVRPGRYTLGTLISKTLEIVGDGPVESIVFESGFHSVIPVSALGGVMRGLTVRNTGGPDRYGLWISAGEATIEGCVIESAGDAAVHITGSAAPTIRSCRLGGSAKHGILLRAGASATVEHSSITGFEETGAMLEASTSLTVRGCHVTGNGRAGLAVAPDAFLEAENCQIAGNRGPGIVAMPGAKAWLWDCGIRGNGGLPVMDMPGSEVRTGRRSGTAA